MNGAYPERFAELDFAEQWDQLPEFGETIDPFDFVQRMAVYKLLVTCSNRQGVFGDKNESNVFWGYVFQLDWQWKTNRLQLPGTPPGRIAPTSPWARSNYSLSIIPLIAAMQTGTVPEKEILTIDSPLEHASGGGRAGPFKVPAAFGAALQTWCALFELVNRTPAGGDLEPIRFQLWAAHKRSLLAIEPDMHALYGPYSHLEQDFLTGWKRMVDFLGTAAWPTDLTFMLENGSGVLPPRLLSDHDIPGRVADMDEKVNRNQLNIMSLAHQGKMRFKFNLWLWRRAMRSRAARDEVVKMLDATFNPTPANVEERRKLLRYVLAL